MNLFQEGLHEKEIDNACIVHMKHWLKRRKEIVTCQANYGSLVITAGPGAGKTFVFEEHDTYFFADGRLCQICLPKDAFSSLHHFILEVNPPDARIRDLGSMHRTHINGRRSGGHEKHETPEIRSQDGLLPG